jgi:arsenate reductase-like glutaredoxin family protein
VAVLALLNPKSRTLKDLGAQPELLSEDELAQLLSQNPKAMFRPLYLKGEKLVIGFKPEELANL